MDPLLVHVRETTFDEPLEQFGWWWLPDDDEHALPGTLRYTPERGVQLDLLGEFQTERPEPVNGIVRTSLLEFGPRQSIDVIFGHTTADDRWTLHDCRNRGYRMGTAPTTSEYRVSWAYGGHEHIENPESFTSDTWRFAFTHFETWVGVRAVQIEHPDSDTLRITYRHHETEEWAAHRGARLRAVATSKLRHGDVEGAVSYRTQLELVSKKKLTTREALYELGALASLLSLLVGREVRMSQLYAFSDGEQRAVRYHLGNAGRDFAKIDLHDMFASYGSLGAKFPTMLGRWLRNAEDMRPVFNLVSETLPGSRLTLHVRFNALTQALEAFHRRWSGKDTGKTHFSTRLRELLAELPAGFRPFITDDVDELVRAVVDTRNYYTHRFREPGQYAVTDDQRVFALCEVLAYWLRGQLLHWAGMPAKRLATCAREDQRAPFVRESKRGWQPSQNRRMARTPLHDDPAAAPERTEPMS
ncbi:MAG: hypothetical protein JWL76_384 [Thermoleophilia bacterium]|nr:hypothetical protein [Thermoleophilia bacterium]